MLPAGQVDAAWPSWRHWTRASSSPAPAGRWWRR